MCQFVGASDLYGRLSLLFLVLAPKRLVLMGSFMVFWRQSGSNFKFSRRRRRKKKEGWFRVRVRGVGFFGRRRVGFWSEEDSCMCACASEVVLAALRERRRLR